LIRWSQATRSRFSVVVLLTGALEGEADSSRDATIREVSGDSRVAFVELGSASLATLAFRGFFLVPSTGSAMSPTALGVGVSGGGAAVVRLLVGVVGGSSGETFLFRTFVTFSVGAGGGGMASDVFCVCICACTPLRDDLLVTAMVVNE
jgi:hypothetical protein